MSCREGEPCAEGRKRLRALLVLGVMLVGFIVLSAFSFLGSRGQATPDEFRFGEYQAADGKRVFQAYNCMGCHTMVGNGSYFAPDLTDEYEKAGPAWLAAFLPSAGGWPTEGALKVQLADPAIAAEAGVSSLEEYYAKYPGARARIERRGGGTTLMPNLPLTRDEIGELIAYLEYTSALNTEGWPPEVRTGGLERRLSLARRAHPVLSAGALPAAGPAEAAAPVTVADNSPGSGVTDLIQQGEELSRNYACLSCHAVDASRRVGPGWGGLYGSTVPLADGTAVTADEAYLAESILHPNVHIAEGYPAGIMPAYENQLDEGEVAAIVAYIRSLEQP
ncbi:MAG TPA: cytochrome c [Woeseiaceae bacterium]|nr:cytochrome c [Woeseiaceae bacterium]